MLTDYVGSPVSSVSFTADGQCLLVGGSAGDTLKLLDKSTGELLQEFRGHSNAKYRVEATLDCSDRAVLSGSENGSVYVWDLVEGSLLAKLDHTAGGRGAREDLEGGGAGEMLPSSLTVHSLSFHPERSELLTAARGSVYVWRGKSAMEEEEEG